MVEKESSAQNQIGQEKVMVKKESEMVKKSDPILFPTTESNLKRKEGRNPP